MSAKKDVLDLSALREAVRRQTDGIEVDVLGMDGKTPLGLKIRVAGPDSPVARRAQEELTDDLVAQQVEGPIKAAGATRRRIGYVAKITLGWTPAIITDGEDEFAFSEANAVRLYTKYRYVLDQVDRAAGDRARFMKG